MRKNIIIGAITAISFFLLLYIFYQSKIIEKWKDLAYENEVKANEASNNESRFYLAMKSLEQELREETDTFNAFDKYDGYVIIEEDTDEEIKYKIVLRSVDLMIHPQYEVFIYGDTLKIPTDEEGNGYFSKSKKVENFDQIEGDIVINDWNQNIKRIPFKYENK